MEIRSVLEELCVLPGVSGSESSVGEAVSRWFARFTPEVRVDRLGSVIALKKGESPDGKGGEGDDGTTGHANRPKIMLVAHMDEVGLFITRVDEKGFLRFTTTGGIDPRNLVAQEVTVYGKRPLRGIIGAKPPHIQEPSDYEKAVPIERLFIDIGMNAGEASRLVNVGDIAVVHREVVPLQNDLLAGRAFDNRAGVAVALGCFEELQKLQHFVDVYGVATVQEEVGNRGAITSTFGVAPDLAVVIDVTYGDSPGVPEQKAMPLGKGPAIGVGVAVHPAIYERLVATAKEYGIPCQIEPYPSPRGTDAFTVQVSQAGVATGIVSIPLRNMHTPVETLTPADVKASARLLAYFISGLNREFVEGLRCF
ncbi:MAG: M20/M25/M40 family metallo-hydrolase [Firmicutes bacterium]|nr:M20/M25/M40 family metallo-hydrolase [Bacillota bacterium]